MSDLPLSSPGTNIPELSVSDLSGALKRTLEDAFGRVRVRGELSKVAYPASGHMYSALKDANAVIDAVCWKSQLPRLKIRPEEGMEVICTGRITTYPARSSYQLVIEQIELAGIGALLKMIEDRRLRLTAEGLFDASRKRALPLLPQTIGIITSPTGAVIRDILHRLRDRFPVHVLLWPVTVQGERASVEIAAAIQGFSALPQNGDIPRPDVIIVARGGGSIEDLMPFNDEALVRAVAVSTIPVISAVGHETDTTLIDYAADLRAPTPTAAAEFAVPVRDDLIYTVQNLGGQLTHALSRRIREERMRLSEITARLGTPERLLETPRQRVDHLSDQMARIIDMRLTQARAKVNERAAGLIHPARFITEQGRILALHTHALTHAAKNILPGRIDRFQGTARVLETLSFHQVLARGFALVKDDSGHIVSAGKPLTSGQNVTILFGDRTTRRATIQNEDAPTDLRQ